MTSICYEILPVTLEAARSLRPLLRLARRSLSPIIILKPENLSLLTRLWEAYQKKQKEADEHTSDSHSNRQGKH